MKKQPRVAPPQLGRQRSLFSASASFAFVGPGPQINPKAATVDGWAVECPIV